MNAMKEVGITFEHSVTEACFGVSKEFGAPNWELHKGLIGSFPLSDRETAAIMALAIGGFEETDLELEKALYAIAKPALARMPEECQELIP